MEIATIVGMLAAFGLIFSAMDDPTAFVDVPSVLIVVAGSIAVVLFRSSLAEFLGAVGVMGKTFKNKLEPGEDLICAERALVVLGEPVAQASPCPVFKIMRGHCESNTDNWNGRESPKQRWVR